MKKETVSQRNWRRAGALDQATAELLEAAERVAEATNANDRRRWRSDLFTCARVYARAVNAMTRK